MQKLEPREKELSKIYRYNGSAKIMFYRPNLLIHSKRVTWLTKEICEALERLWIKVNKDLAIALAKVHDDGEIITWDIVATKKSKWTKKDKEEYKQKCKNAINILYENYKDLFKDFDYKELLELEIKRDSKEFFIIKYADRLDAHLECIHEIYWWNKEFVERQHKVSQEFIDINKKFIRFPYNYKSWKMTFFVFTHTKISKDLYNLWKDFNIDLKDLEKEDIFNLSKNLDVNKKFKNSKKHTLENLQEEKCYKLYNLWIDLHFKYWTKKDIQELYLKKNKDIVYM